jgi:hypothetical protein
VKSYPIDPAEFWQYLEECRENDERPARGTKGVRANSAVVGLALDAIDPEEIVLDFEVLWRTMHGRPVKAVHAIMRWLFTSVDPADWRSALLSWHNGHPKERTDVA